MGRYDYESNAALVIYTPEQKEEVKKALAAGVPKATILTYFYPEVTVEKMSTYRKKQ